MLFFSRTDSKTDVDVCVMDLGSSPPKGWFFIVIIIKFIARFELAGSKISKRDGAVTGRDGSGFNAGMKL